VRLAESLDLTRRERNELVLAARFAPAFPESSLDDAAPRPIRVALDTLLDGHLPFPAMVVRPHGILVTANRAFELFHEDVAPLCWRRRSTCSASPSTPTASRPGFATCRPGPGCARAGTADSP